ncbi:MAG: hypothetical protein R3F48_13535 [Candidatus Zixiibacteriota bacterium]
MDNNSCEKGKMAIMLLKEAIWKVEDRLNVILESIADHEAEIIRLRQHSHLSSERLTKIETRLTNKLNKQNANDR